MLYVGTAPLASYGRRYHAQLLDSVILAAPEFGLVTIGLALDRGVLTIALFVVGVFLVPGIYEVTFVARSGQTIGKRALGIRVVSAEPEPVGWIRAAIRFVFKFVDLLPPVILVTAIALAASINNQTLHDHAAKTLVVRVE